MSQGNEETQKVFETLLLSEEEQLYEELGLRSQALGKDFSKAGELEPEIAYDAQEMGPLDELKKLGVRIFNRWNKETYKLLCAKEETALIDREELLKAFTKGETAVATLLCSYAVTQFGLAPIIATVIVTIVLKRFFRPAYEELCKTWEESFDKD